MDKVFTVYAALGATVLVLALGAGLIKRYLWISEPLLATGVGILIGPAALALLDPANWGNQERILEELARVSLAIALMGVAFRLPDTWIRERWRTLGVLLLLGMPGMWLFSSGLGWAVLGLPLLQALLLGALISPTDPVVASSIVTGELAENNIDENTRHMISAESGANDGLAYLLVMLPALLLERPVGDALAHWGAVVLLGKVVGSILGGMLAGYLTAKALEFVYQKEFHTRGSILAVTLALALALLGFAKLMHGDGILAVFAAGLVFNWMVRKEDGQEEARHERMQETTKRFFEVPVFLFFGMILPFGEWASHGWPLYLFGMLILLLRRLPVILALRPLLGPLRSLRHALFVGWFGPIGVAAMVYVTWADVKQGYHELWIYGSFVIFLSLVIHGITATPFTRWYRSRGSGDGAIM